MPRLPYTPELFPPYAGTEFEKPGEVTFTWQELCRGAVTVGRRNWADVLKYGTYSILEALWRVAMIRANLMESPKGRLLPSRAFSALDPSEKGAVSYFLGLVITKILADKLFRVPWLLHLDVYRQELALDLASSEKPDFAGLDAMSAWLVLESKTLRRTNLPILI